MVASIAGNRGFVLAAGLAIACAARADDGLRAGTLLADEAVASGTVRSYRLAPLPGRAARLTVRQRGDVAVELRWRGADGGERRLRTEGGSGAVLRWYAPSADAGSGSIEVAADPAADGREARYAIALDAPHARTRADAARAEAVDALARADALRRTGSGADAGAARKLYAASVRAWNAAADACGARQAYVALAGFEHESSDAAHQQAAAQAALEQPCADDLAHRALAARLLGSARINQGDFAAGVRATERAVAAFRRTGDRRQQGIALRNLGLAYAESGELGKALATTAAALQAAQAVGDTRLLALVRNDIALVHNARGEYALAVDAYRRSLAALRENPYPLAEAVAWINLGVAYAQLDDPQQAFDAYDHAEAAATAAGCASCLAEIEADRGDDLLDSGAVPQAEAAYGRALGIAETHGLVRQRAEALRGLGRCAIAAQDWERARRLLSDARAEMHRTGAAVNESVVLAALGDLDSRLGNLDAARANYARALALAREAENQAWQAAALASLARVEQQAGELVRARADIEAAIALIESERARIGSPDLRTSYFGSKRSYYDLYVDVLMQLAREQPGHGYEADALGVAERARARALQDQLAERAIRVDSSVAPALIAAEAAAQDRLHALAYRLSQAAHDDARRRALLSEIDEASRALDEARGRIRAANPRYAELTHPARLQAAEIQRDLLDGDMRVLEYWLGDARSYLWVVDATSLRAFTLPPKSEIAAAAGRLRESLLAPIAAPASVPIERRAAHDAAGAEAARAAARALAERILPPAAQALLAHDVAVVADGELQAVPFAVLDWARDAGAGPASIEWTYLPSLGALRGLRALPRPAAAPTAVAVVADPVFRADDARLSGRDADGAAVDALLLRAASEAGVAELPRLPHTRDEAQAIAALADREASWVALDFAASRRAVAAAAWPRYTIVHFATHALLNARHPELSGIVLSLYDAQGRAEDGFLRVNDIYNLRMPADLVVLSVCESALGRSVGAEGAANLARAFFYAGTRRVVASLWPVDDRAGAAFMQAFYRALLARRLAPAAALVEAQRELRRNPRWSAPYYWGGYVLQGDWR